MSRRSRQRGITGEYALHLGRTVRDVHGAILWCHIGRLVYAAPVKQLASKIDQIMISSASLRAKAPFVPISITGGVLADEAMQLFAK
jgi:tRNA(Arg) A34 adenosine deaminase TadA